MHVIQQYKQGGTLSVGIRTKYITKSVHVHKIHECEITTAVQAVKCFFYVGPWISFCGGLTWLYYIRTEHRQTRDWWVSCSPLTGKFYRLKGQVSKEFNSLGGRRPAKHMKNNIAQSSHHTQRFIPILARASQAKCSTLGTCNCSQAPRSQENDSDGGYEASQHCKMCAAGSYICLYNATAGRSIWHVMRYSTRVCMYSMHIYVDRWGHRFCHSTQQQTATGNVCVRAVLGM